MCGQIKAYIRQLYRCHLRCQIKGKGEIGIALQKKKKFALWLYPETQEKIESIYKEDNCRSRSEFIEKAIDFYYGYLTSDNYKNYLPNVVTSTLKGIVAESDNRQNRMMFKMAVEIAILENLVALSQDVDPISLKRLRGECVKEVKRLNGSFSLEDAAEWQKG